MKYTFILLITTTLILLTPQSSYSQNSHTSIHKEIHFGIITDVHADMLPDGKWRMDSFIKKAEESNLDFIIQLGDFCRPREQEQFMLDTWNEYEGEKYHVIGNHDVDFNTKQEIIDFWGIPSKYYSYDIGNFHFIVLDANYLYQKGEYIDYAHANFYVPNEERAYINPEQIEWLKKDLQETNKRTIIFSHQSLINVFWGVKNRMLIQEIFETANKQAGFNKVIACFNGHDHIDFHREINGIHYFEINSVAYQWLGEGYGSEKCFDSITNKKYQHLNKTGIYKDPLYAFIKITEEEIIIDGVKSEWFCKSQEDKLPSEKAYGSKFTPEIKDRTISLKK